MEETSSRLADWAKSVIKGTDVSFEHPRESDAVGVFIYLLDFHRGIPLENSPSDIRMELRFLILVRLGSAMESHAAIERLYFAAANEETGAVATFCRGVDRLGDH